MNKNTEFKPDEISNQPTSEQAGTQLMDEQLKVLKDQRKQLKAESNRISRLIGDARRAGRTFGDLKARMQNCSAQLKALDARIKTTRQALANQPKAVTTEEPGRNPIASPSARYTATTPEELSAVTIQLEETDDLGWNDYCLTHPAGSIHHRFEWKSILGQSYGLESYYFSARTNGKIRGILPLVRYKSRLFGDFMVSMPWFAHAGAIADHPAIEQKLMRAAADLASELKLSHVEFRDEISRQGLPVQSHKVNMILQLPDSPDALWQSFPSKLRSQIKRPLRENPTIEFGGTGILDEFHRVYSRNMRDLGSPSHSKAFLRNILEAFPEHSRLVIVRLNGQPVGGGFLLGMNETLEIPLASTIRSVNHLSMNMLLYWEVLKFAIEQGFKQFDFGRSSKDAGTYRFKIQWGATPKQLYWHYWLKDGTAMPSLNTSNPKYAVLINVWKRIPVSLSLWLSAMLIKHIP